MQVEKYFKRIKYKGPSTVCFELLEKLQQQHLLHIPFENLDIHWKIPIELNTDKIFDKIVNKKRGGFCYELNSLFYGLLVSIGFEARMVSARVYESNVKEFGREYDHMAIIVHLEENEWLVDVGFGEFSFCPLRLVLDEIQSDKRGKFMITKEQDTLMVSKTSGNEWVPEYLFTLRDRRLSEFEEMCHRSEEHTSELQSQSNLVCRLLLEKKNKE